ncbi:MAG: molybdopterin molybdotransferase MoeA [Nocardioidaceae bacterium]|nr:molybdopterin molybdotransferase MoeA [Nocardioidaceae bacterium]
MASETVAEPTTAPRSVDEHLSRIIEMISPLQSYDQSLLEAHGLPACEDVLSPIALPRFDNSAMDGYAVRRTDVEGASDESPIHLPVVGESAAGSAKPYALAPGTCLKIMTGAPMPAGADAVAPIEWTDGGRATVRIFTTPHPGQYVRRAGEDVWEGDLIVAEGVVLGPRHIGLLASVGRAQIRARPRPRVVVLSTGSELRDPGTGLGFDSIYDGNSFMLAAAARAAGAIAYRVGIVSDNPQDFSDALSDQLVRADVVVTSGGVSKGEYDVVKDVLSRLGTVEFCEVAMQPGKPQGFGRVGEDGTPIFTLPGNPVSAYISFEVFVAPALRRMMGRLPYRRPLVQATLTADVRSIPGRRQFVRAWFEVTARGATVSPVGGHGSHLVGDLARANALVVVAEDVTSLSAGEVAGVMVLDRDS